MRLFIGASSLAIISKLETHEWSVLGLLLYTISEPISVPWWRAASKQIKRKENTRVQLERQICSLTMLLDEKRRTATCTASLWSALFSSVVSSCCSETSCWDVSFGNDNSWTEGRWTKTNWQSSKQVTCEQRFWTVGGLYKSREDTHTHANIPLQSFR